MSGVGSRWTVPVKPSVHGELAVLFLHPRLSGTQVPHMSAVVLRRLGTSQKVWWARVGKRAGCASCVSQVCFQLVLVASCEQIMHQHAALKRACRQLCCLFIMQEICFASGRVCDSRGRLTRKTTVRRMMNTSLTPSYDPLQILDKQTHRT